MKVALRYIVGKTLALLDENETVIADRVTYGDPATDLRALIRTLLPDAAESVLKTIPAAELNECDALPAAPLTHVGGGRALMPLPGNFLRLLRLRMSDWSHAVHGTLPPESEEYALRFAAGRRRHGAVALIHTGEGRSLEIFGTSAGSSVAEGSCLLAPRIDGEYACLPESALRPIIVKTAEIAREVIGQSH